MSPFSAARRIERKSDNHHDLIVDRDPGFLIFDHVHTVRESRTVQRGPNTPILATRNVHGVDRLPVEVATMGALAWADYVANAFWGAL